MNSEADRELLTYLERRELARLWPAARERLEHLGRVGGTARLSNASLEERRAVAALLGSPTLPGENLEVTLARLDRALRESRFSVGLAQALELLSGPLRNLPAEREAERRRRAALWRQAEEHPLLKGVHPAATTLRGWLGELRGEGLLRRLAGAGARSERELLDDALRVLAALPTSVYPGASEPVEPGGATPTVTPVRRGVLAAATLGSSHALDAGSPVATLVLRALARLRGDRDTAADGTLDASTAADRRALWESAGVVLDELSSQVLVLGLAPPGDRSVAAALRALATAGQPARITLRQLGALEIVDPPPVVRVCENPVVVSAAADRLGASCPPLICPEGVPSLAARQLLSALARTGVRVLYHGDFDWPGVRIATGVADLLAATCAFAPWRFSAADYRAALTTGVAGRQLGPGAVSTPWDPDLSRAMVEAGVAVEEEVVLETLLTDLQQAATKAGASGP